jgi:hypothetical protein
VQYSMPLLIDIIIESHCFDVYWCCVVCVYPQAQKYMDKVAGGADWEQKYRKLGKYGTDVSLCEADRMGDGDQSLISPPKH